MTQKQTLATTFHASQKTLNQTQPLSERHLHPKVAGRLPSAAPTMTASETTLKLKQPQRTANKTGTRLNVEKPSLTASLTAWQLHQLQGEFMIEPFCPLGRKEQLARRYHIKDADVIKVSAHIQVLSFEENIEIVSAICVNPACQSYQWLHHLCQNEIHIESDVCFM